MKKKEKKNKNKKVRKKKLTWHNAMLTKATNYRLSLEFPEASLKLFSLLPYRIYGCTWHESRCVSELNYYHLALEFSEASLKLFVLLPYRIYGCTWHESRCVSELNYYHLALEFPEASLKLFSLLPYRTYGARVKLTEASWVKLRRKYIFGLYLLSYFWIWFLNWFYF